MACTFAIAGSGLSCRIAINCAPQCRKPAATISNYLIEEAFMTHRIGNKDVAQQRSKADKKAEKKTNVAMEAIKKEVAKAKYRNAVKGQPG